MCVTEVFLTALSFSDLLPPPSEVVLHSCRCLNVPECPWEGLGTIRHLRERGASSEGGAIICHVECITPSFLTFFQFGENTQ